MVKRCCAKYACRHAAAPPGWALCHQPATTQRLSTKTIVLIAFDRLPDGGKGLLRDTCARWVLKEMDQP
ncbi:hypothetical protein ACFFJ4_03555 [Xanthomonas dyei]|uniref:Uncharacterized protein n=1 Tax=Xanthomonas dyei TaxID=743699 RepID=A0A2S7CA24_9XANT|nr:hypothetical protein [Xanthomonas dyei]PPU58438.1 hypothetical protein XdyCFBP7245_02650 [Xanthomonas dyei]